MNFIFRTIYQKQQVQKVFVTLSTQIIVTLEAKTNIK